MNLYKPKIVVVLFHLTLVALNKNKIIKYFCNVQFLIEKDFNWIVNKNHSDRIIIINNISNKFFTKSFQTKYFLNLYGSP